MSDPDVVKNQNRVWEKLLREKIVFPENGKISPGRKKYPTPEPFVSFPSLVKFADDVRKSDKKAEEREKEEKRTTTSAKNIDQEGGKTGRKKDRTDERDFSGNWSWTEDEEKNLCCKFSEKYFSMKSLLLSKLVGEENRFPIQAFFLIEFPF